MTRGKKVLFSFTTLIFAAFLFTVFVHYQIVYSSNVYFIKLENYPIEGSYLLFYLYWGSIVGMVIIDLAITGIVFKLTEITLIKLSEGKVKLETKKVRL